jgi:two-component system cell cycle response regulator DivK
VKAAVTHTAAPIRVLIIDDAEDNRERYQGYLQYVGFRVAVAGDAPQALKMAHSLRPDVFVLDLSMPQIDGWTLCEALKGSPRTRRISVIALSRFADANSRARALAAGVDTFLSKPCLPEELAQEILRHVPPIAA